MAGLPVVTIYTDGGARGNPGPAAIGVVICGPADEVLKEHREYIGHATNNEAEYRALSKGLDLAAGHTRKEVHCVMDSELVMRHLTGAYRVRSPSMRQLFDRVKERERRFEKVRYRHRPRLTGMLRRADALVNEALDAAGF